MGWKNIKEHYRIGHIVQVCEGRIAIGSPYVSDIITVTFEGEVAIHPTFTPLKNDDLERYVGEMKRDGPAKVKALIDAPDRFKASLPVFTYDGAKIIEKKCEEHEWPNCTHDGLIMYENTFSPDRGKVIEWAKRSAESGVECYERMIREAKSRLSECRGWHEKAVATLVKLQRDFPDKSNTDYPDKVSG